MAIATKERTSRIYAWGGAIAIFVQSLFLQNLRKDYNPGRFLKQQFYLLVALHPNQEQSDRNK